MREIRFFVEGDPKTAGSKVSGVAHKRGPDGSHVPVRRPDGSLVTFTKDSSGEAGRAWRTDIRAAARDAMREQATEDGPARPGPLLGPVSVTLIFRLKRPASHFRSGANAGTLKDSAPRWPTTRPDIDKLSRAMLDALKGIAWGDDGQVVWKVVTKRYADPGERVGADVFVLDEPPDLYSMPETSRPQLELT